MAKKKPIKLITLDTETYNGLEGALKRIAIYDGVEIIDGYTYKEIKEILKGYSKKYDVHVYIHNLEFDARKMDTLFDDVDWSGCLQIKNKLATIKTTYCTIHDSFKILPYSLDSLSKDFDVSHKKLSLFESIQNKYNDEYNIYNNDGTINERKTTVNFLDKCHVDDELYLEYLHLDVISLYEILKTFMNLVELDESEFVKIPTTASLSRQLLKNGHGKHIFKTGSKYTDYKIMTQFGWTNHINIEKIVRASYSGGRTEIFKPILNHQSYHYDINSMYPFVMLRDVPVGKYEHYTDDLATEKFEQWLENHNGLGVILADVYVPPQHIPPLPVKMGKLVFPTGNFCGTWTYNEIEYAIKHCGVEIKKVYEIVHFKKTYPVFKNFIEHFYKLKEQASKDDKKALKQVAKLIMNTGYGYTGMTRDDKYKLDDVSNADKYKPSEIVTLGNEKFLEVETEIKSTYIQVPIASYICSYARLELLKVLQYCNERGNVYYCDTDSIVTDVILPDEWVDKYRLGAWDCEEEPIKGIFLRPKVYAEKFADGESIKFKGITKDTQQTLNFSSYENLLKLLQEKKEKEVIIERDKTTLRSITYLMKNDKSLDTIEKRDKKINLDTIEKREINYNENYTKPLHFENVDEFSKFSFKKVKRGVVL